MPVAACIAVSAVSRLCSSACIAESVSGDASIPLVVESASCISSVLSLLSATFLADVISVSLLTESLVSYVFVLNSVSSPTRP